VDVSVVIATRDRPDLLARCLSAIAGQRGAGLEAVVVNDGGRPVPARVWPDGLESVQVAFSAHRGQVAARNAGLALARGRAIVLCDDDDVLPAGHVERALTALARADVVYPDAWLVLSDGRREVDRRWFSLAPDAKLFQVTNPLVASGTAYLREWHDRVGRFDESLEDYWDWDWWLRLLGAGARFRRIGGDPVEIGVRTDASNRSSPAHAERLRRNLNRLSAKHRLGPIAVKNFWGMLDDADLAARILDRGSQAGLA
jgi:glycosyltransferase involved in cell wall biosynthesis